MNRLVVLLSCLLLMGRAYGDEETLLGPDNAENGSYFAPKIKVSNTAGRLGLWPGARLGWTLGNRLGFGFEGYVLANEIKAAGQGQERLQMALGGVVLEAISHSDALMHAAYSVVIGAGGVSTGKVPDIDTMANQSFIYVEPGFNLEINVTRSLRICPGVSYLWISGSLPEVRSKWDVSETAFNLTLKFRDPRN